MSDDTEGVRARRNQNDSRSQSLESHSVQHHSTYMASGIPMGSTVDCVVEHKSVAESSEYQLGREESGSGGAVHNGSLRGDRGSIALLICLYILQGIPLGLAASIPYLMQSRKVSYKDQAVFSFVSWPFSLKLLWAPIVDSVYLRSFGRRKSWLIPTQYLIGFFMLALSRCILDLMGEGDEVKEGKQATTEMSILTLTVVFFMLNFLAATQDIAVDGWALNMLSKQNVGWVSTCNTVGQTAGFFLGNVVFLALESADFCNKYLRSEPASLGVVTLPGFFFFWGIIFLISTTLVMFLKTEVDCTGVTAVSQHDSDKDILITDGTSLPPDQCQQSVLDAYKQLWKIVKLSSVFSLIGILLTMKIGFAAADAVTGLKLMEEGVPKEHLAMMAVPMIPIDIILPVIITKYMSSQKPLNLLLRAMPFRLLMGLLCGWIVWWAPSTKTSAGVYPSYFYFVLLVGTALHQVAVYSMFVPLMAFFAKVSDPMMGGTYMTLLNTISNLGGNWPSTVVLSLVDGLTLKGCANISGECTHQIETCNDPSKLCTLIDGYYIESIACIIIGCIWLKLQSKKVRHLQDLPPSSWRC